MARPGRRKQDGGDDEVEAEGKPTRCMKRCLAEREASELGEGGDHGHRREPDQECGPIDPASFHPTEQEEDDASNDPCRGATWPDRTEAPSLGDAVVERRKRRWRGLAIHGLEGTS